MTTDSEWLAIGPYDKPILETAMSTDLKDIVNKLTAWKSLLYLDRQGGCNLSSQENRHLERDLTTAISLLESTGKDTEMLDFVIRCLNEKTPDEFNAMVWREFQRGSSRFDRGSITAAMQKEEVEK